MFVTDEQRVTYSAHKLETAEQTYQDVLSLIDGDAPLRKRLKRVRAGTGQWLVEWTSGQQMRFKTRTKSGGRGLSGDKMIMDEAQELTATQIGALMPTLAARRDPQILYGGSAGKASAVFWRSIRDRGRAGVPGRLAYAAWTEREPRRCVSEDCSHVFGVAVGCALDDEAAWAEVNTQLYGRIGVETMQGLRESMPAEEFAREFLGRWDEPSGRPLFDMAAVAECVDPLSRIDGETVFSLNVSPDRSWAAIAVAGMRADGLPHVEVTGRTDNGVPILDHQEGTSWVVPRLAAMAKARSWFEVRVVTGSPAAALVPALRRRGVEVVEVPASHTPRACGLIYDQVSARELRHLGQAPLVAAFQGARKRGSSEESAFVFGHGSSGADVTPLYAAADALLGAVQPVDGPAIY